MPQASDADRARYRAQFPDIGAEHAIHVLEEAGYTLTEDWTWIPPKNHEPTDEERFLVGFLIYEWDFCGFDTEEAAPRKEGEALSEEYPLGPKLAGAIYEALSVQQRCEDVVLGAIHDFMREGDCEFKRFDYYDTSIEFWCKPGVELSELDRDVLCALGFSRCWVCYRESKDGEWVGEQLGERYYSLVRASSPLLSEEKESR